MELGKPSNAVSTPTRHELAICAIRECIERLIPRPYIVAEVSIAPKELRLASSSVCEPDGLIRIERPLYGQELFFIEVDMSTETLRVLETKAKKYAYLRYSGRINGDFVSRYNRPESDFRVLFVFKSCERRNNLCERVLSFRTPILTQIYTSTLPEVLMSPYDPIWVRPIDYRDAVRGTAFELTGLPIAIKGRRLTRDRIVELKIKKVSLFEERATLAGRS